jgi:carbon storage regulator
MLVMRRRAGESVLIGGEIEIEILEVGPTRVKLGIVAPANLAITRKEVILTRSENLTASRPTAPEVIAWLSRKLGPQLSKDNSQSVDPGIQRQQNRWNRPAEKQ